MKISDNDVDAADFKVHKNTLSWVRTSPPEDSDEEEQLDHEQNSSDNSNAGASA